MAEHKECLNMFGGMQAIKENCEYRIYTKCLLSGFLKHQYSVLLMHS